ncbi:MAG: hypothetical protein IPK82_06800 [Polyangiaceae bacterium]|nr:hypothetical protein [Polyangiaceae bacterium]
MTRTSRNGVQPGGAPIIKSGAACLLGTELEVVAEVDLQPLLESFQHQVAVIRNSLDEGRYTLWVELTQTDGTVEDAVRQYTALVKALPPSARTLWDSAIDRCLNTGVQAGYAPHAFPVGLSTNAMALAVRASLRHVFTIYAQDDGHRRARRPKR